MPSPTATPDATPLIAALMSSVASNAIHMLNPSRPAPTTRPAQALASAAREDSTRVSS